MELDVGDGGTLGALGVRSGGNVLGEERDSDWRVDASDVDTGISSRLNMYNIYILIRTCLFACLMLVLPRRTHAPLHSREQAYVCLGGDSKFSHFFLLLDKIMRFLKAREAFQSIRRSWM